MNEDDCQSEGEFGGGKPEFDPRILEAGELQNTEWEPPNNLTIATVTNCEGDTIPLKIALNLLAYGEPCFEVDMDKPDWPLTIAKKTRAWRALANEAKAGVVVLYAGDRRRERINSSFFCGNNYVLVPGKVNSIEPDLDGYSDEAFAEVFSGRDRLQVHCVHVDRTTFVAWLRKQLATWEKSKALPMTDDDLRQWIQARETELNRRPPIAIRKEYPELSARRVTRARFEAIWHELYPEPKRGRPEKRKCPERMS